MIIMHIKKQTCNLLETFCPMVIRLLLRVDLKFLLADPAAPVEVGEARGWEQLLPLLLTATELLVECVGGLMPPYLFVVVCFGAAVDTWYRLVLVERVLAAAPLLSVCC